jgi:hypothetical protein
MRQCADSLVFLCSILCGSPTLVGGDRLGNGHVQGSVEHLEVAGRDFEAGFPGEPRHHRANRPVAMNQLRHREPQLEQALAIGGGRLGECAIVRLASLERCDELLHEDGDATAQLGYARRGHGPRKEDLASSALDDLSVLLEELAERALHVFVLS